MSIFYADTLNSLKDFADRKDQLGIVKRKVFRGADSFFHELMQFKVNINGQVRKKSSIEDIRDILKNEIPIEIQGYSFYKSWIFDMSQVSKLFCDIQGTDEIGFWLGSQRGCHRYHIDAVPLRMLVTYAGKGTEWLPDEAANRRAFSNGESNEKIIKNRSALQFMNEWDVAIFRGGSKGLLHRTPDAALSEPSILMRLDNPSFWENVLKL
tara:strand:+ start:108 stop:737 length:630 start_codon:yes stop_codon:yes gene_type:complete